MTLMRVHEDDRRGEVASLPTLVRIVTEPATWAALEKRAGQSWMEMHDYHSIEPEIAALYKKAAQREAEQQQVAVRRNILSAERRLKRLQKEFIYRSLKTLRDKHLAHNDISPKAHGAKYGFETRLLRRTIPIVHMLNLAVDGIDRGFSNRHSFWKSRADDFWKFAIGRRTKLRKIPKAGGQ